MNQWINFSPLNFPKIFGFSLIEFMEQNAKKKINQEISNVAILVLKNIFFQNKTVFLLVNGF